MRMDLTPAGNDRISNGIQNKSRETLGGGAHLSSSAREARQEYGAGPRCGLCLLTLMPADRPLM